MTHRPYPNADRALRQLDRHDDETPPLQAPRPLSPMERTLVEYARAAVQSAAPALASLKAGMQRPAPVRYTIGLGHDVGDIRSMTEDEVATLRQMERPVSGEEKTA